MDNKKIFSRNLQMYMSINGKTRKEVSDDLGISYNTFTDWYNGKKFPRMDKVEMLANYFGILKSDLIEDKSENSNIYHFDNVFPISKKKYPLLGEIACGEPIFAEEDHNDYAEDGTDLNADFCLKTKGDSMSGIGIHDGDIVFIKEQPMVDNGDVAAVIIGNEVTLKRVFYYPETSKIILQPANLEYEPLVYIGEELNTIRILGKAVAYRAKIK